MSGRRVIVVTGGSGFVGGHVVRALVAAGHDVRSVGRRPGRHDGDRFVYADLRSAGTHAGLPHAGLPRADLPHFGDATVVHCAAATRDGLDPEVFDTNLALTRGALALADGPFVHLSSSSVYNLAKPSVNAGVAAADGAYPWLNSYGESKYSSEGIVADAGRGTAIILRPHAVYGAGDTTLLPRLRRAIRLGVLPLPGGGHAAHALTAVENLVAAVELAVGSPLTGTHTFNVTDAEPVPIRDAITAALGRVRIAHVPVRAAMAAARLAERRGGESLLTRYSVLQLAYERTYDLGETRRVLGYEPGPSRLGELAAAAARG